MRGRSRRRQSWRQIRSENTWHPLRHHPPNTATRAGELGLGLPSEKPQRLGAARNRPLLTLMLGHLTVDMYAGVLPVLYPLLTEKFDLKLSTVGLVALAYSGMASISQPFFGWIADRYGTRLIGLCLMWTAATFAILGFVPTFPALLALAALAGIGSGAYHPHGRAQRQRRDRTGSAQHRDVDLCHRWHAWGRARSVIGAVLFRAHGDARHRCDDCSGMAIAVWMLFEMRTISIESSAGRDAARSHSDRFRVGQSPCVLSG